MKRIIRLTENDLARIVRNVLREGVGAQAPMSSFPNGIYMMKKVEGDSPVGTYLKVDQGQLSIYTGNYEIKNGGFYGGGTIYVAD